MLQDKLLQDKLIQLQIVCKYIPSIPPQVQTNCHDVVEHITTNEPHSSASTPQRVVRATRQQNAQVGTR